MYQINFNEPIHIYFIGIGGISMSGLAEIVKKENFKVSGSDMKESALTNHLDSLGIKVYIGQNASNLGDDIDVVVYTAAIHPDNPEFMEAQSRNLPMLTRAEFLGQLMRNYKTPIAVSGTHGKTTTTSMLSHILLQADTDPTLSIGGILKAIDGNIRVGNSQYFLTEACEYTNSFLSFYPKISIILNIDADHLDFFKDLDDIRASFKKFAALLPEDGTLIVSSNIENLSYITEGLKCNIITFGTDASSDYSASSITFDELGRPTYTLVHKGKEIRKITLAVTGIHNVYNSLSAIAAADLMGIDLDTTQKALLAFSGTERRFEYKGEIGGITIIDDYAHHPTEIKATLSAAENYPHNHLWCVFQPHTYTRTKALMKEFADALSHAENIILAEIYPARETDNLGISSATLAAEIEKLGKKCTYFSSFDEIETFLLENCAQDDLLITMGAGDVVNIGNHLLGK
ncbi:MAG: UDP-N-acetylmuramate--L-alanine ligase [Lachnospiraceae bacterium]|nr:UDP-N-acetylmuramate--L-alanine ligase [Lachnospiraceae bacterium]